MAHMRINTHVREENEKTANKILRKGRGAWGDFVNNALEVEEQGNDLVVTDSEVKKSLTQIRQIKSKEQ